MRAWLEAAEAFDSWRVIPRLILFAYSYWMARVTNWTIHWYFGLPAAERTNQVTAFVTVVLPGIFGLAVWVYKVYAQTSRDWNGSHGGGGGAQVTNLTTVKAP